jgi:IMP dehydrogenase
MQRTRTDHDFVDVTSARAGGNDELFDRFTALTFDDVVVVPGYSEMLPADVDTSVVLARDVRLQIPVLSAAMDRVTESRMAIALAREGGLGVIHRNLDAEDQAAEVRRVKRSQSGMITDPVTLGPDATVAEAEALMARFRFSGVPIVNPGGDLIGIITNRDIRFMEPGDETRPVRDFMTSEGLVTARTGTTLDEAKALLRRHRIEKLPLVEASGRLTGLITVKDLAKHRDHPHASIDERGRLRVAAAIGVGPEVEKRVETLVDVGVDAVAIDTAHGHSKGVIDTIAMIRSGWPNLIVLAGNVVTAEGVEALAKAGADAIKVGVGAGSICTTRVVAGAGMPQLSAIHEASLAGRRLGVALIGDGGVTYSGDLVKAIAAGASLVMLGSALAGTDESPGETELFEGRRYKSYRGMGSMGALSGRANDRYAGGQGRALVEARSSGERVSPKGRALVEARSSGERVSPKGRALVEARSSGESNDTGKLVPEGIEGRVPHSGPLHEVLHQLIGGLRAGMGYAGAANLAELSGARLMRVTAAGRAESHPHDVQITKEAPNYSRGPRE